MFKRFFCESSTTKSHARHRPRHVGRLEFETLEDRRLLATFTVINNSDGPVAMAGDLPGSLRQAIFDANANSGADTISFGGLFDTPQTIALEDQLTLTDAVTIAGPGQDLLTLDAGNGTDSIFGTGDGHRVLNIDDGNADTEISVALSGLTLTGGDTPLDISALATEPGGAIRSSENLQLINSTVTGNSTGSGVVESDASSTANSGAGGGVYSTGTLTVTDSIISGNATGSGGNSGDGDYTSGAGGYGKASGNGGGIFNIGILTVTGSTISGNVTGAGGGDGGFSIYGAQGGDSGNGGGIFSAGPLQLTGSTVSGNATGAVDQNNFDVNAGDGAGVYLTGVGTSFGNLIFVGRGDGEFSDSTVSGNTSAGAGGGIFGQATLINSTVSGNTAQGNGGGIDGRTILTNSRVSGNESQRNGGGIFGTTTLTNSAVTGNTAQDDGGGIAGSGRLTDSTVAGNTANGNGGGIEGSAILTNSTVSGNTAQEDGGGINITGDLGERLTLTNSTISRNSAQGNGGGANIDFGQVRLTNSTVSGNNSGGEGGGIIVSSGRTFNASLTARNSIIAGNSDNGTAPNFESFNSAGNSILEVQNSIIGDTTGTGLTAGNNNQLNVDFATVLETEVVNGVTVPLLTDNGGEIETIALLANSPAIDAGDNALAVVDGRRDRLVTDQRNNVARLIDGDSDGVATVDIGAYEFSPAFLLRGDVNQDGEVDFSDIQSFIAVLLADGFQDEADIDRNGTVDFEDIAPFISLLISQQMETVFTVSNNSVSGPGSLSQAILDANFTVGADTIEILPSIGTIQLTDELNVTDSVTIEGNGNTIVGNTGVSRIFNVSNSTSHFNLNDVTLSGGGSFSVDGGAVLAVSPATEITVSDSILTGNKGISGGAINAAGPVTITNSEILANDSIISGGGINANGGVVTLVNSTVSGNSAADNSGNGGDGGGIFSIGAVNLTNSSVDGNSSTGDLARGGGIYSVDAVTLNSSTVSENSAEGNGGGLSARGGATLNNSTVSGNSTGVTSGGGNGGGIFSYNGTVALTNSTVSGNSARTAGGIRSGGDLTILNSIVAGNSIRSSSPDFEFLGTQGTLNVQNSIIGDTEGTGLFAGNNNQLNIDFTTVLETEVVDEVTVPILTNNGGDVETIALLANSPAIDAGNNILAVDANGNSLLSDQRGSGFDRIVSGAVDIGAYEFEEMVFVGDLIVDSNGDVLNDDFSAGDLTLREAIAIANVRPGADAITFAASVLGSTIALTGGELRITDDLTITGPGSANDLIIDAQAESRVFTATEAVTNLTLESLSITNGLTTGNGGGILFEGSVGSTLTLIDSTVSGNSTTGDNGQGGGIFNSAGDALLSNSTVSGNSTTGDNGQGGGIFNFAGDVSLANSAVSGNTTTGVFGWGGGIYNYDGSVMLTNSTVSGNSTAGSSADGGGIFSRGILPGEIFSGGPNTDDGDLTLINSTVSGNSTTGVSAVGGGIFSIGALNLTNSTVAGNTSVSRGGGISFPAGALTGRTLNVRNSIIAGNLDNGTAPDLLVPTGETLTVEHSIIGDTTGTTLTAGNNNQLNVDFSTVLETEVVNGVTVPRLTDNGGSVETIALLAVSPVIDPSDNSIVVDSNGNPLFVVNPAIDAGDNALAVDANGNPLLTDQRGAGFDRIFSGTSDIGAFEFGSSAFLLGDVNQDGVINFSDISPFISVLQSDGFLDEADINGDGVVDFADISFFIELLIAQ